MVNTRATIIHIICLFLSNCASKPVTQDERDSTLQLSHLKYEKPLNVVLANMNIFQGNTQLWIKNNILNIKKGHKNWYFQYNGAEILLPIAQSY